MIPALVTAYGEQALAGAAPGMRQVHIAQEGEMWLKPGGRSRRFTAVQELAADRVAFSWRARFPIVPLVAMKVVDEYVGGEGRLSVRLLGRTLQQQQGQQTSLGEAIRYLAELVLVPHALSGNPELSWTELGDRHVEVATQVASQRARVVLEFDAAGDVARASCSARPFQSGETSRPWQGTFADYRVLGGIRMPTRAEVAWDLPEGRYLYWRGRITEARALDTPFASTR